jgi:hypothetical protein
MIRFFGIIFFLLFSTTILGQDEILSPLETNLSGAVKKYVKRSKTIDSLIVYSTDTLKIPIFDDFSTNHFQKYDSSYTGNISNKLYYSLISKFTNKPFYQFTGYTFNKTYTSVHNLTSKKDTSILNKSQSIVVLDLTIYPPTSQEKLIYPKYTYYDTIGVSNSHDSISINVNDVQLDSARVFFKKIKDNNAIWIDSFAYHNYTLAYQPWSLGVASFDGLDDKGFPYAINTQSRGYGDYLTSKNIDLSNIKKADSIYISFLYQPKGYGDAPENIGDGSKQQHDSLCLQLYRPDWDTWVSFWATTVNSDPDLFEKESKTFRKVHLPIKDSSYYKSNFKFRFANYGDISGSLDHFHLDYVELKKDSKVTDTNVFKDFALVYPTGSLIKGFTSVPWEHYKMSVSSNMNDSVNVTVRNGFSIPEQNLDGTVEVYDKNSKLKSFNLPGQQLSGGDINYLPLTTYVNYFDFSKASFIFPKISEDSASFFVKTIIPAPFEQKYYEAYIQNDTSYSVQNFKDYYAYDDGSAELAYGLKTPSATLAYKFEPYVNDSLLGVAIHFVPTVSDKSKKLFAIYVWDELNGLPNKVIYKDEDFAPQQPVYQTKRNVFTKYYFKDFERIPINGNFFIGIKQFDQDPLNIGFDANTVTNSKLFYANSGTNWNKSITKGAVMIRPIFSTNMNRHVGLNDLSSNMVDKSLSIYPNPTMDIVVISPNYFGYEGVIIYDIQGNILSELGEEIKQFSADKWSNGIYLMKDIKTGHIYKISKQ